MKTVLKRLAEVIFGWLGSHPCEIGSHRNRPIRSLVPGTASWYAVVGIVAAVLAGSPLEGANHFIRAGATGAANGNNWTDAWTSLPSSLVRGDTYYIADGTYPA